MRLKFALPMVLIMALSGCAGSPPAEPVAKTTAQVASAVAKSRPQLEDAMTRFDNGRCPVYWETESRSKTRLCVNAITDVANHSRAMQKDLEEAKPWSEETSAVAKETVARLEKMVKASTYGDGQPASAIESLRTQLQSWKPFGA